MPGVADRHISDRLTKTSVHNTKKIGPALVFGISRAVTAPFLDSSAGLTAENGYVYYGSLQNAFFHSSHPRVYRVLEIEKCIGTCSPWGNTAVTSPDIAAARLRCAARLDCADRFHRVLTDV